ncbi:LOW QUALITY PROTEIN: hypothetical protein TorRG33x02_202750 [Trema orientale]|uniref:Uncharacterized protein n=1 Tax=Trema orientale TaxID=63057 RepID=A0A2P5EEL1_TREOI|nr:LOW QUALITY PROTEIN: hypothetical protein TorRG33x02_202750 [Trema orientale]
MVWLVNDSQAVYGERQLRGLRHGFVTVGGPDDGGGVDVDDGVVVVVDLRFGVSDGGFEGAVEGDQEIATIVDELEVGGREVGRDGVDGDGA